MSATPLATFLLGGSSAPNDATEAMFIGGTSNLTIRFDNTGSSVGYAPYIDLDLDALASAGLTFAGASYLGVALQTSTVTFSVAGTANSPFAKDASGNPVVLHGTPGTSVVVIQLPFGSFAPSQTPADIQVALTASATMNIGNAVPVIATAGFAYGENPLGTPQVDWPVVQASPRTLDLQASLVTVHTTYNGPESEVSAGAAFGQIFNESFTVSADIAIGQVLSNFILKDPLPDGVVATSFTLTPNGGATKWIYNVDTLTGSLTLDAGLSAAGAPTISSTGTGAGPWVWWDAAANELVANFGTITGTATDASQTGTGPEITTGFTLGEYQTLGSAAGASNGGDLTLTDMLPYGAVGTSFTITGPQGSFIYSISGGTATLVSGPAGVTPPAILGAAGTTGTDWVWWDATDGKIVADFGMLSAGQTGRIDATYIGGQYQGKTGYAWQDVGAGATQTNLKLYDQLPGGTAVTSFTVTTDQGTFVYAVDGSGHVSLSSGNALLTPAIGTGVGANGTSWVWYDAANDRIEANLASVSGGSSGVVAAIQAQFSGGMLLNASNPQAIPLSNGGAAQAVWNSTTYGNNSVSGTVPNNGSDANAAMPGSATIYAKPMTIEKSVAAPDGVVPGQDLVWTIRGEVGSYADIQNLVLTDTLSDGQHFDDGETPLLVVDNLGTTTTIALSTSEYSFTRDMTTGTTSGTVDISQAMIDNGLAGDLNGGAAPTDATPNPQAADFQLIFDTTIDNFLVGTSPTAPLDAHVEQGDVIGNAAQLSGNLVNGGAAVADGSAASAGIPVDSVHKDIAYVTPVGDTLAQAQTVDGVNSFSGGFTPNTTTHFAVGDLVTYHLQLVMPETDASNVTLTDFLPLPVFAVLDPNGSSAGSWSFDATPSDSAPGVGTIEFTGNDTFHDQPGITGQNLDPTISVDSTDNALVLNFGSVHSTDYAGSTLDLLLTVGVTDAAFAQNLLLTNQVTSSETDSYGNVSQSNAIIQFTMDSPELKIEKGVVATNDSRGTITGTDPTTWSAAGSSGARFSGTINDNALASTPLASSLTHAEAGDIVTFAVVVQNYGSSPDGAFDVSLQDLLPSGYVLPSSGLNLEVTNGAGQALAYTMLGSGLSGGIELTDPTATQGALADDSATSGANIAVITYDLQVADSIPVPDNVLVNTATVTNFAAEAGGANRTGTEAAGNLTASSTVTTAMPVVVKTLVSSNEGFTTGSTLAIGEVGTFDITLTLPEGNTSNLVLKDVLPTGLDLVSASVLSVGSNLSGVALGDTPTISGQTISLAYGSVTDTPDGVTNANDQVVLQVVARAGNDSGNAGGVTLTNTGSASETDASTGSTDTQSNTASVKLVAPELSLVKTASASHVQAGDTVTYTLTLSNGSDSNSAPAFNAVINDAMAGFGSNLTFDAGSVKISGSDAADATIVTGNGPSDTNLAVDVSEIDAGQNVVVTFNALVNNHALDNTTVNNSATATGQTLPGGDVAARTETVSGAVALQVDRPTIVKALVATSDANTSGNNVAVGETLTYDITVTLPQGDSSDVLIADAMPTGLSYIAGSAAVESIGSELSKIGGGAVGAPTVTGAAGGVTLDFGGVYDAPDGITNSNDQIVVQVQALVQNIAGNTNGHVLTNTGTVTTNGAAQTSAVSQTVELPHLLVNKSSAFVGSGPHDAGAEIAYSITVDHAAGDLAAAYVVDLSDNLPTDESLVSGSVTAAINGVAVPAGEVSVSGTLLTVDLPTLLQNQTLTIGYDATLNNSVTPGETLTNTAGVSYQTEVMNGDTFTSSSSSSDVVALAPSLAKTIIAQSDSSTDAPVSGGAVTDLAVGEQVTYQLVATLQAGTQNLVIRDPLASNLTFVSAHVASIGADITGSSLAVGAAASSSSGGNVVFNFGTVVDGAGDATVADNQVVVDVVAQLASGSAGSVVGNTGTVTTSGTGGAGSATATSTVSADVVAPHLTLSKSANVSTGHAGTVVTYTLTIAQASDSTAKAYNLALSDALPSGETLVAGSESTSAGTITEAGGSFTLSVGSLAYTAGPITVTYQAVMANSVTPGETLTNNASLTYTTEVSNGSTLSATAAATDNVVITPAIAKTIIAQSDSNPTATPIAGAATDLAVGETVTYQLLATLQPGTQNLVISDQLASNLSFVSAHVASLGADISNSNLAVGAGASSSAGGDVVFNFGTVTDAAGGSGAANQVAVDVTARLTSGSAGSLVANTGTVATSGPAGAGSSTQTSTVSAEVAAPDLTVTKSTSFTTGDAGDLVTYTVTIAQAVDSTATAYNLSLSDGLSSGLMLVSGSETTTAGTVTESGGGLTLNVGSLDYGAGPITLTYQARLANNVVNGGTIPNTASLTYDSEASSGQVFTASASDTVHAAITDTLSKALVATSAGPVMGNSIAQGETLTFDLTATLGEGEQVLTLSDVLPTGYSYVGSSVVSLGSVTGSALAVGATGSWNAGADTVSFNFGTLTNPGDNVVNSGDQVVVAVKVLVGALAVGTNVTNTGTLTAAVPSNTESVAPGTAMPTITASVTDVVVSPGTITGHVYDDGQNNGIYHIGDAGIAGVTVELLTAGGVATGISTVTDNTGSYSFNDVVPGNYEVQFVAPKGMVFSPKDQGSNSAWWSIANAVTGISDAISINPLQTLNNENALLNFNSSPTATAAVVLGAGQNWDGGVDTTHTTVIGSSGDNVHDGSNNTLVQLHGGDNIVETGSGTDIVLMCGGTTGGNNAQALGTADYIATGANTNENFLQGGQGADYLLGGGGTDRIAGGAGPSVLVGGGNNATVTLSGGVPVAFSKGDELLPGGGTTAILYQRGDGVDFLDSFDPSKDTIDVFGYSAPLWVGRVQGYQVMWFGGNDMLVFNGGYMPTSIIGPFAGIDFYATIPSEPDVVLSFDASGNPTMMRTNLTSLPSVAPTVPLSESLTVGTDTNGDGMTDLVWQNTNGLPAVWDMTGMGALTATALPNPGPAWSVVGTGDFNGDGKSDLVLQNTDGSLAFWMMDGTSVTSSTVLSANPGPSWNLIATGDFNGDGYSDLLFQNNNGTAAIWEMQGTSFVAMGALPNPGISWHIVGVGAFDQTGAQSNVTQSDIVWQNNNGSVAVWEMNGLNIVGSYYVQNPGPDWHVVGVGDFNGDGNSDLVLQANDGDVAVWLMTGYNMTGSAVVASPGADWHVIGTGDFNADGKSDILLQNNNGTEAVWLMNGTSIAASTILGDPGVNWHTVGESGMRFLDETAATGTITASPVVPEEFIFTSWQAGAHTIAGFNPALDMLELPSAKFSNFAALMASTTSTGGGSLITLDSSSSLFLSGVAPSQLNAAHVALV